MVKIACGTEILALRSILFCYFLSSANCKFNITINPRIIGGTKVTDHHKFPYQALLLRGQLGRYAAFCGAVIIGEKHVLTAAHCIVSANKTVPASSILVVVGNLDLNDSRIRKKVEIVYVHERFNPNKSFQDDIALLKMLESFGTWTQNIRPLDLKTDKTTEGTCVVSGFGITKRENKKLSPKLMYVEVPIVDFQTCKKAYDRQIDIGFNVLCASSTNKDSCTGDSGGPFVCSGKLAGIVSFGPQECGSERHPGIYTEIAKYLQWIEYHKALGSKSFRGDTDVGNGTTPSASPPTSSPSASNGIISLIVLLFIYLRLL